MEDDNRWLRRGLSIGGIYSLSRPSPHVENHVATVHLPAIRLRTTTQSDGLEEYIIVVDRLGVSEGSTVTVTACMQGDKP